MRHTLWSEDCGEPPNTLLSVVHDARITKDDNFSFNKTQFVVDVHTLNNSIS